VKHIFDENLVRRKRVRLKEMKIEKKVEQRKVMCVREIKTRVELCDMCYN